MNEEAILALQANGYTYTGGGIIDAEGKYQESVNLFGVDYTSTANEEEYNLFAGDQEEFEIRKETERLEKEAEITALQDYEKDPLSTSIDTVRPETYDEYMAKKVEDNQPGAYDFKEDFVEQNESKAVAADLQNNLETGESLMTKTVFNEIEKDVMFQDKGINFGVLAEILPTEKRIKEIEGVDEDVDTVLGKIPGLNREANTNYKPDPDDNFISSYLKDPNRNIFTRLGDSMWEGIYAGVAALTPDGVGMDDKILKKEYVELNEKREAILKPEIEKITAVLKEEKDFYDKDYEENYSAVGSLFGREEQDINNYVRRKLQSKVDYLEAFTEDSNIYNLISEEFLSDVATFGLRDGHDALKYRAFLTSKIENREDLTETEQRAVENLGRIDLLDGLNLEQNALYNLVYGAGHSVSYLAGGVYGRAVGKGVGTAVSKGVVKGLEKGVANKLTNKLATEGGNLAVKKSIGNTVGKAADIGTQATLHTSNISNTVDNYFGKIHMAFDKEGKMSIETDRMQYDAVKNEISIYEDAIASGKGTKEQIEATKGNLRYLKEILGSMKEPQTVAGAMAKSWTGNFVESASEVATLSVIKGIPNNLVTRKLTENFRKTPTWAKITSKTKGLTGKPKKFLDAINKPFPKTMEALNNFSGNRIGNATIGGNLEEALEEVVVQVVPVWGETEKEAAARKAELLKGSFYFNVLAQAPLQKIIMSPVGNTIRAKNYLSQKMNKDYRETRRNFKALMKDLQKEGITKEEIDGIMMAAGSGNFSQIQYKNKIKELDDKGEVEQARKIRENRIFNGAYQAMKHGKGKEFIAALESSLASQNAPTTIPTEGEQKTQIATMKAITEAKAVMQSMKSIEGMPNAEYVLNLEYNRRNLNNNKEDIQKEIVRLGALEESEERDAQIATYTASLKETENALRTLDKKITNEKAPGKLKRYRDEKEMMTFARQHLAKQKEEGATVVPLAQAMKDAFGKSVSNASYKKVNKLMEVANILQTAKEENTEVETETESETETPDTETANVIPPTGAPTEVQNPFGAGTISEARQEIDNLGDEFKESVQEEFQVIEDFVEDAGIDGGMDILMNMDEDEMISSLDRADSENNPLVSIGKKMKTFAQKSKERTGKTASFEDFLMAMAGQGTIENYQDYLTLFGNAWSNAGLGKVDVQAKYLSAIKMANQLAEEVNLANLDTETTETQVEQLAQEEKVLGILDKNEEIKRDINGIPVIEQTRDEVFDEVHKVNYSALEFIEEEVTDEETGETYIRRTNAPIPQRNSNTPTDVNNLVNPNKNNKGDLLTVGQPTIEETGKTFVSVRNEKGKTIQRIPFSEWVDNNRGDMSIEEFSTTEKYISKIPMYYVDSEGKNVGWVAESDWFNPSTEGENDGDKIKVSNLSQIEELEMEQKRRSALNLRKEILAGNIKQFEIVSDGSSFVRLYFKEDAEGNTIPPKSLSEVAATSHIAVMGTSGLNFVEDGVEIKTEDILNWGDSDAGFSKKVMRDTENGKSKKAVVENAGKTVYVEHVTTINGVKKYEVTLVLRKNEEGKNQATQSAIETVRILSAANTILMNDTFSVKDGVPFIAKSNPYRMTREQAQQVHDQVKKNTGLSLSTSLSELVEGLVAIKNPEGGKIISGLAIASLSNRWDVKTGHAAQDDSFMQNTKYGRDAHKGAVVSITKGTDGQFVVEKIADSYETYLKDTLSTNMMGYNVGTEETPLFTPAIQQAIRVKAIRVEDNRTLTEKVEEVKTEKIVEAKTQEIVEDVIEQEEIAAILETETASLDQDETAQRDEALATATALINQLGGSLQPLEDTDELVVSEMTTTEQVTQSILITEGLTVEQEEDIIGSLGAELANPAMKYDRVLANLTNDLNEADKTIAKSQADLEKFKGNLAVENVLSSLETLKDNVAQVQKNKERLLVEAWERGKRDNFVVDSFEETEGENVKDYSKKSNEAMPVDKLGTALKRIFAQVDTGEKGFLGRNKITPFKSMYDTVLLTLTSSIGSTTDFKDMMAILSEYKEANFWVESLIDKLESSDESIQNAFVYNMHAQKVTAYFSGFTQNASELNVNFFESNSNSGVRVVKNAWRENFKRTEINKKGKFNKDEINRLYDEYLSWGVSPEKQTLETLQTWLENFGIRMSDNSMKELMKGELKIVKDGVATKQSLKALFEESAGVFNILNKFLIDNKDKKYDVDFYTNKKLHPFNDMHSVLDQLAYLEVKHNARYATTTRRSGQKSLSEVEDMTYYYQQIRKLKNSILSKNNYVDKLRSTSFSKDSYMLKMLVEDPEFLEAFDHGLMDLMSLKDLFKDTPMFAGIDELSEEDYQLALRVAYQSKGRAAKLDKATGFKIRLAQMNTVTNSDKGRMMIMKTFVYDFFTSDQSFVKGADGSYTFSENVNELMYDNYVMPELRRMFSFIKGGSVTDIKGYKEGAERFNIFPVLNTVKNEAGDTIRKSIMKKLAKGGIEDEALLAIIKEEFFAKTTKEIEKNTFAEAKKVSEKRDSKNDKDFMAGRAEGTMIEKNLLAEVDFILNSKLSSMNYMQMIAGDPAMYYKVDKEGRKLEGKEDVKSQTFLSIQSAVNVGKRMAAMIAPGKNLADSKNNQYIQLFLEDIKGAAENLLDIVGWHYSQSEISEKHLETGRTYREMIKSTVEGSKDFENILKERFSDIADFIGIESTDAQEYTTIQEHLYVLEKQGRLPQEVIDDIRAKIKLQKEFYDDKSNEGLEIPKDISFSSVVKSKNKSVDGKTQLEILLQPIKPVYTGSIIDGDVNRIIYIKSSSFPLIPELTKGRKLDALRVQMERLETETGKTVRASYQSANKVGALTKDKTVKNFTDPISIDNGLVLDREHFKIQQDVPSKANKVQEDYVSMGTQIFKLLFGDGIDNMKGFEYQGETVDGETLKEEFFQTFSKMVNLKKDDLLSSLGLNADMKPINEEKSKVLLQKLLKAEAESRGFSKQDLKAIELVGKKKVFRLPLWATGNSNKFEAMLNALINNKIFKQKIPGNKFVTGSEAGFDVQEEVGDTSNIIHIGDYTGGVLKSTKTADGKIVKAEVLMPSRFKLGGQLIDIFEGFNPKTGEGTYINLIEGKYQLREEMFDKEVLEQFVFRIPTSSHGLGSAIKIVGFLPPESGDLIITPKGFVAQMGQDFDIDSLTAYQYNHIVRQTGKVEKLTDENKEAYLSEKLEEIDTFKTLIAQQGKYGAEVAKLMDEVVTNVLGEDAAENFSIYPHTEQELNEMVATLKAELPKNFDKKILENKFVETHISVFSNPKAQSKINKALSMAYTERQAEDIQKLVDKVLEEEETFDMLSPEYQRVKMNNGSTGQVAIGIYAKAVTLHSNFQQALSKGGVHLTRRGKRVPVQIGKLYSAGNFGTSKTLTVSKNATLEALGRAISTVLDERTNTGTDNEKAQILGKTGLNHKSAIAVDSMLAMLGFDSEHEILSPTEYIEGEPFHRKRMVNGKMTYFKEYSIPYLLHSQPIIKEYFAILNQKKSISNDTFSLNNETDTRDELLAKYGEEGKTIVGGRYGRWVPAPDGSDKDFFESDQRNADFTGKRLADNIILNDKADNTQQLEILALYIQLMGEADGVKEAGQLIDMNNLGKSMWESSTKEEAFREYFSNLEENSNLEGIEHLIGEIYHREDLVDGKLPITSTKPIKEGVSELFKENPELAKIGTEQEYSDYLDTIFPESKGEGIVYHNSDTKGATENFKESSEGIFFTPSKEYYGARKNKTFAILNIKNSAKAGVSITQWSDSKINQYKKLGFDSATARQVEDIIGNITEMVVGPDSFKIEKPNATKQESDRNKEIYDSEKVVKDNYEIVVFEPEQIHVLGSKKDIQGFKENQKQEKESAPLINLGDNVFLRPTTNQGVMVGTALSLSANLFNGLFPAKSVYLNNIINKILDNSKINVTNSFALTKGKEHIFQEVKKYLTSAQILGLFNTNAKEVRESLFTDIEGHNTSLGSYIDHLYTDGSTEFKKGIDKVRNNLFLNLLNFQYGEDGRPSLITFNNQESFEANQEAIYTAFKELIAEDISLPRVTRNGTTEYYSTRKMAQELIAYSYVSGGIVQGALEFHKFLPIEYLDDMVSTASNGREMTPSSILRRLNNLFNDDSNKVTFLEEFEEQFFQNNPNMAKQIKLKRHSIKGGGSFFIIKESVKERPDFISEKVATKSKLKQNKWELFKLDRKLGIYYRVPVLGTLGMAEYEYQTENLSSSILEKEFVVDAASGIEVQMKEDEKLGILPEGGTPIVDVVDMIARGEFGDAKNLKAISKFILPLLKKEDTFDYNLGGNYAKGSTKTKSGKVSINTDKIVSREDFAITFLHESLHNLSSRYINQYVGADGSIHEYAPSEIYTFMSVYNQYKDQLRALDPTKYDNFIKEFKAYKQKKNTNESVRPDMFTLKGDEFETYYAMVNPREFLAVTLSNQNEHFKTTANAMNYLALNKGFRAKLTDVITRIINSISKRDNLRENSVALQAIQQSLLVVKGGSAHNYKRYKKAPVVAEAAQSSMPSEADLARIEEMMIQDMMNEQTGNIVPEGPSAGVSFESITGLNNKCK